MTKKILAGTLAVLTLFPNLSNVSAEDIKEIVNNQNVQISEMVSEENKKSDTDVENSKEVEKENFNEENKEKESGGEDSKKEEESDDKKSGNEERPQNEYEVPSDIPKNDNTKTKKRETFFQRHKGKIIVGGIVSAAVIAIAAACIFYKMHNKHENENENEPVGGGVKKADDPEKESCTVDGCKKKIEDVAASCVPSPVKWAAASALVAGGAVSTVFGLMANAGDVLNKIQKIPYAMLSMGSFIKEFIASYSNRDKLPVTPEEGRKNLEALFNKVKGQHKAKEQLKSVVNGIILSKNNTETKKDKHSTVLYFIGPSGIGKSFMAKGLAENNILSSNNNYYQMSAQAVDSGSSRSIIDQLFAPKSSDLFSWGDGSNKKENSSLFKYIKNNPNGVVIIDEYDKILEKEQEAIKARSSLPYAMQGVGSTNCLDEFFRGAIDQGIVRVAGQELDCSGITFILTSNETKASLNIKGANSEVEKDDTALHYIYHDKSFTNRLKIIEFQNIPEADYIEIVKAQILKDLANIFGKEGNGEVKLVTNHKSIKNMAQRCVISDEHARYCDNLHDAAATAISEKISDLGFSKVKGKSMLLDYDLVDIDENEEDDAKSDNYQLKYVKVGDKYKKYAFMVTLKEDK